MWNLVQRYIRSVQYRLKVSWHHVLKPTGSQPFSHVTPNAISNQISSYRLQIQAEASWQDAAPILSIPFWKPALCGHGIFLSVLISTWTCWGESQFKLCRMKMTDVNVAMCKSCENTTAPPSGSIKTDLSILEPFKNKKRFIPSSCQRACPGHVDVEHVPKTAIWTL